MSANMLFHVLSWLQIINLTLAASFSESLRNGVCLCINEPNVAALSDPRNPSSKIATLSSGTCFISNGGTYHSSSTSETMYELRDTTNGQLAWVDSFYLTIYSLDKCNSASQVTKPAYHQPDGQPAVCNVYGTMYAHGQHFQVHGLDCRCDDGAMACSFSHKNCFSDGIVYPDGTSFTSANGSCICKQGTVTCDGGVPVGK